VISEHGVRTLFCAPTAFRAIRKEDPDGHLLRRYDISSLRSLFLAGERLDPPTYEWARDLLGVPVVDHWWQTETGWPIAADCLGIEPLATKPGSASKAVPGYEIVILDESGNRAPPRMPGDIAIRQPLPPGTFSTLWNADDRFVESYFRRYPGYYSTGDGGYIDDDGYVFVMGRIDDVINVAGHRLSTGAIEGVLAAHPDVAECAVIGVVDSLKGQVPLGLVVLKTGVEREPVELRAELVRMVRESIGPVASFREVEIVPRLPKTRSGKILRATMRAIADGREYTVPSTIEDVSVLGTVASAITDRPARPS
jgi:propionyl-CoA synthetase